MREIADNGAAVIRGKGAYREIAANPPYTKSKTIIKYVLSDAKQVSLNPSPPPSIPPTKTQR